MLVEAFPAAQLQQWSLLSKAYSAPDAGDARRAITAGLKHRIDIEPAFEEVMIETPDALDAVIALFAAVAAARGRLADSVGMSEEGLIAVHR